MIGRVSSPFFALLAASAALARPVEIDPSLLACWPPADRGAYADYESELNAQPTAAQLKAWHELLGSEPHIAGTEGDRRNIERIRRAFEAMGLETRVHEIWPYLCTPKAAELELITPAEGTPGERRERLDIREFPVDSDPFAQHPDQTWGWNAYSGSGDVTAEVVYANYGTKEDFARLGALGVEVRGRIAIARYGGNFRGYKAKFAEEAGAAGLIIFTDPADSGYMKGLMYPEGGFANASCIQRGSIVTLGYAGDPLTPGEEATRDAARLDGATIDLPRIPVQPVGWVAAQAIMGRMAGALVPEGWQGGMPFAYRLSGGPGVRVRLHVEQERGIMPTANVIATLRGTTEPDRFVVIGCHHDAWGCGAADPLAGTICLMEAARSFAELARAGRRPARTIVFAAWAAEEFGIVGSTEWVEGNRERLMRDAVAYINLDMASMGPDFGAGASPSLRRVIAEAARAVAQARDPARSVFEAWIARGVDARVPGQPGFGDTGGGSDHVAFLCYAGVGSCGLSGGGSKGTSYHSTYDTLPWYWKTVGDDYEPALMVTRMASATASRLSSAPVVPLDPVRWGPETRRHLAGLTARAATLGVLPPAPEGRDISPALARIEGAAVEYEFAAQRAMDKVLATLSAPSSPPTPDGAATATALPADRLREINDLLLSLDRAWLHEPGIRGRPWYQNLFAATDEDSGYAAWMLPELRACIEHRDAPGLENAVELYLTVFARLTETVRRIEALATP